MIKPNKEVCKDCLTPNGNHLNDCIELYEAPSSDTNELDKIMDWVKWVADRNLGLSGEHKRRAATQLQELITTKEQQALEKVSREVNAIKFTSGDLLSFTNGVLQASNIIDAHIKELKGDI